MLAGPAGAGSLRIATYNTELAREGPGLLLRDILSGKDEQVGALVKVIASAGPDILLLQGVDYDFDGHALGALARALEAAGQPYPFSYAPRPNTGMASGFDLDRDGRLNEPEDAQGFGRFSGQGGMALLSRLPIDSAASRDFSDFLWKDLPGANLPEQDGAPYYAPDITDALPLANSGMWDVVVSLPDGTGLHLLAMDAQTPVFDGPEDRNGRRNGDQLRFWRLLLDGALPFAAPEGPVVLVADANLDPEDGAGLRSEIAALIEDPRLQDPLPVSPGGALAANPGHRGDPARDTVDWDDPDPGNLRVDYVLPGAGLTVTGAGVVWPAPGDPLASDVQAASRHRLVWVDIALP